MAKASKPNSPSIVLTQLLFNEKLCKDLLPNMLCLIEKVKLDSSSFTNPPLILPLLSETLFILNKLYEGFKKLKITSKTASDIVHNYKSLAQVGESLAECFLEKCLSLFMAGDDCFQDKVSSSNQNSTNQTVILGKALIYLLTSMIQLGKCDHAVFYEFFSTRSSDIYLIAVNAFMVRKEDAELFDTSYQNYMIDLDDTTEKHVGRNNEDPWHIPVADWPTARRLRQPRRVQSHQDSCAQFV